MTGEKRSTEDMAIQAAKKQRVEETDPVPTTPDHWPDAKCFGDTVEVIVGLGIAEETHVIHQGLLCFYSEYFRASLDGEFREAKEKKVELDDVDPKTFALFKGWLYTRKLCTGDEAEYTHDQMRTLCKLFVFGDKHIIPLLKNNVINIIIRLANHSDYRCPETCGDIEYAYHSTPSGSPLRRILMDAYAGYCCEEIYDMEANEDIRYAHPDAVWDLAVAMKDIATGTPCSNKLPSLDRACEYHEHPTDIKCSETFAIWQVD